MHEATWAGFLARYGYTPHRLVLLAGLKAALDALQVAGCSRVYINGSFVTAKDEPADFDACWETQGVDVLELHRTAPELLDFANHHAVQKATYGGELFPADLPADRAGANFLDYFQRDKHTGRPKGIMVLDLGDLP